jgi:hypothetical protein
MVMMMAVVMIPVRPGQGWVVVVVSVTMESHIDIVMSSGDLPWLLHPPHSRATDLICQIREFLDLILQAVSVTRSFPYQKAEGDLTNWR